MYRPSQLCQFLSSIGTNPKKGLSQNFLIDGNIVRKIVQQAEIKPDELVLEIGPGPGALTEELLRCGARVVAVEKDKLLADKLKRLNSDESKLTIFSQDIMQFDLYHEMNKLSHGSKIKVVANLPYHLTTPILAMLIKHRDLISSVTVMVQEEVGRRMSAEVGTKDFSSLSIFLDFFTDVKYCFKVKNSCFYPVPKIDSCIVQLKLKKPPLEEADFEGYFKLVRTAFQQKRKMIRSSLSASYDIKDLTTAFEKCNIKAETRPQNLTVENFVDLYLLLNKG